MLLSLHIENVAVIKCADMDFRRGFTALTGETGAGKSMIIDSIGMLIGNKTDKMIIRTGADKATVIGVFDSISERAKKELEVLDIVPDEEGKIIVYRSLSTDGRSLIKINSVPQSLTSLRSAMASLLVINGQNDSLLLMGKTSHEKTLDKYAGCEDLLSEYTELYKSFLEKEKELEKLDEALKEKDRVTDLLSYQLSEIDAAKLKAGEEEQLKAKLSTVTNLEKISKHAGFVYKALKGGEKANALYIIDKCILSLNVLEDTLPEAKQLAMTLDDCRARIDDVAESTYAFTDGMDGDPTDIIDRIQSRLDLISRLSKKYGNSIEQILAYRDEIKNKLSLFENSNDLRIDIENQKEEIYKKMLALAKQLHDKRTYFAKELEGKVGESLEFLDMPKVSFVCSVTPKTESGEPVFDRFGYDDINFLISANAGMALMPLDKIASGGELARIMLSLKSVLADADGIDTVIYDEIDSGVSGKTARKIGLKLQNSAKSSQVFSVTHSAQIASLADNHLLISKKETENETQTTVRELDEAGRIDELSRILGGINVTDAQRLAAIDMLMGAQ